MQRAPGSLLASVLLNRGREVVLRYVPPRKSTEPGRFDAVKHFLVQWEGLLLGSFFFGGLLTLVVKVYLDERFEDLYRRINACRLAGQLWLAYYGKAAMPAHLARIRWHACNGLAVQVSHRRQERQSYHKEASQQIAARMAGIKHSHAFFQSLCDGAQARAAFSSDWCKQQQVASQRLQANVAYWQARVASCQSQQQHSVQLDQPCSHAQQQDMQQAQLHQPTEEQQHSQSSHKQQAAHQQPNKHLSHQQQTKQPHLQQPQQSSQQWQVQQQQACEASCSSPPTSWLISAITPCWSAQRRLAAVTAELAVQTQHTDAAAASFAQWTAMAERSTQKAAALKAAMVSEHQRLLVHVQRHAAWRQLAPRDAVVDGAQELSWPTAAGLWPAVAGVWQGLGSLWVQLLEGSRELWQEGSSTASPAGADSSSAGGSGISSSTSNLSNSASSVPASSMSDASSVGSRGAPAQAISAEEQPARSLNAAPATTSTPEQQHGVQYSRGHMAVKVSVPRWVPDEMEDADEAALAKCPARPHSQQQGEQAAHTEQERGQMDASAGAWGSRHGAFGDGSTGDKLLWQMAAAVSSAVVAIVEAVEAVSQD